MHLYVFMCVCQYICEDPCAREDNRSTLVSSLIAFHIIFSKQDLSLNVELADSSRLADQQGLVAPLSSTCTTPSTGAILGSVSHSAGRTYHGVPWVGKERICQACFLGLCEAGHPGT